MAKKSSKSSKEDKVVSQFKTDMGLASDLYKQYFPQEALPEYLDPYAQDQANLLNLRQAYADPNNASFAGKLSGESLDVLQGFRDRTTPGSASYVGSRSSDITDIIGRFKGGLEGYTAAENQALRESSMREVDSRFATDKYNASRRMGASGMRGGALQAQVGLLERDRQKEQAQMEQDIFLKNADEKQSRLKDFTSFMTDLENTEYGRGREAMQDYAGVQKYMDDTAFLRGQGAIKDYEGSLGTAQNSAFQFGQFNIGQKEKTIARDTGGVLGLLGTLGTRRTNDQISKYIK